MFLLPVFALLASAIANPGYVSVPITRVKANATFAREISNKGYVPEVLLSSIYAYLAAFSLGGQHQFAVIDTGSSDLCVYGVGTGAPWEYDPVTGFELGEMFAARYLDGTNVTGEYYIDNFVWDSVEINLQFAVSHVKPGIVPFGVFGIGDISREASTENDEDNTYDNLPVRLKNIGLTSSVSYSMYLGGLDAKFGEIIFGAFDTSRFTGKLKAYDVDVSDGFRVAFTVKGERMSGELDSGTALTYLDDDFVRDLAGTHQATWDPQQKAYKAPGKLFPIGDLTFHFYGVEVRVPAEDLWHHLNTKDAEAWYLTILPNSMSGGMTILGDNFMRSAYIVYDLDHRQVAIGRANPLPGASKYVLITDKGIPPSYLV